MKYDVLIPGLKEIQSTAEAYYLRSDYIIVCVWGGGGKRGKRERKKKSGSQKLKMFLEKISTHLFKEYLIISNDMEFLQTCTQKE